jgi:hypothetical protein
MRTSIVEEYTILNFYTRFNDIHIVENEDFLIPEIKPIDIDLNKWDYR